MVLMLLAMGCQQDLVRVMGSVTGVVVVAHAPSAEVESVAQETPSPVATVSEPIAVDPGVVVTAAAEPAPTGNGPGTEGFNPISMPQGPRDSPGVRWEGVRGHSQEEIAVERGKHRVDQ